MDVSNVGKPSHPTVTLKCMKELTMGRNPMDVSNLGKAFLFQYP
jgi:hypothetical protein